MEEEKNRPESLRIPLKRWGRPWISSLPRSGGITSRPPLSFHCVQGSTTSLCGPSNGLSVLTTPPMGKAPGDPLSARQTKDIQRGESLETVRSAGWLREFGCYANCAQEITLCFVSWSVRTPVAQLDSMGRRAGKCLGWTPQKFKSKILLIIKLFHF
ncbi:hypothetical protein AVEN_256164-1 [Araneus ventricosus]|uniref:Uncharacterized protein n=1 Tax=Araneus ventricosus TaxID=182803 RepID=A0A4Y2P5P5_ARAVE|nr:hypothetical protein AVEN_256164-1 [Araneus ventricosus]